MATIGLLRDPRLLGQILADPPQVVLALLHEPAFGAATKCQGEPQGHGRGDPGMPVQSSESALRVTPSAPAAAVIAQTKGSRQSSRMTSLGWGGLCIMTSFFNDNRGNPHRGLPPP